MYDDYKNELNEQKAQAHETEHLLNTAQTVSAQAPKRKEVAFPTFNAIAKRQDLEILLDRIVVEDQVRKHFDEKALNDLAKSIEKHGLMEPIVVWGPDLNQLYHLIAGERRYRAHKILGLTKIKCSVYPDKPQTVAQKRLLQITENTLRENLTTLEMAENVALLCNELSRSEVAQALAMSEDSVYRYCVFVENLDDREKKLLNGFTREVITNYNTLKNQIKSLGEEKQELLDLLLEELEQNPSLSSKEVLAKIKRLAGRLKAKKPKKPKELLEKAFFNDFADDALAKQVQNYLNNHGEVKIKDLLRQALSEYLANQN